jgi:hypothetical protein
MTDPVTGSTPAAVDLVRDDLAIDADRGGDDRHAAGRTDRLKPHLPGDQSSSVSG